uniref:Transmembrane protein 203 n=1 Tax=Ascaris suum TaxID=6253 RepID=F1L240_ASCSU
MLSIVEVIRWTNITIFELWLHCVGTLIFSVLLTVKLELYSGISYWYVFTPLFVASAFNCYFLFIVFVRTIIDEKDCKAPFLKYAFSWLRLVMLGVFEALLCYKINGDLEDGQVAVQSSYGVIFLPIWVLMAALCFQACRLL